VSVDQLRNELRMIAEGAEWHALNYALDAEPDRETLTDAIADFMGVYCQTAALLAADWYNHRDSDSRFFARPVSVMPPKRAEDTTAWVFRVRDATPQVIAQRMSSAAYTMTYDAARDTVSGNASAEGVAYVRVEEPGACDDCVKRATLLPRASTASSEDISWERHQRCEFLFEPVRQGVWMPPSHHEEWREKLQSGNPNGLVIANSADRH
jgi:hypothetical protein